MCLIETEQKEFFLMIPLGDKEQQMFSNHVKV